MIPRAQRTSPSAWRKILFVVHGSLMDSHASDIILFGSQAMSVYMKRALASKDLDLIVTGIGMTSLSDITESLRKFSRSEQLPTYDYGVTQYEGREYPVSHVYFKPKDKKPFVIELFHTFLGYEVRRLTPYVTFRECWGKNFQVPTLEAVIGTRIAFRPPERITVFNARRINRLVKENRRHIDWMMVKEFIHDFQLQKIVSDNLAELKKRHNISILDSSKLDV
jgi:hypothetical protein